MATQVYLPGPSVCGFWGMFESDFGDPSTSKPYPCVTPSMHGSAVMAFRCPHCDSVVDFTSPERRGHFRDSRKRQVNYWCPSCHKRFYLNLSGKSFKGGLDENGAAPAVVQDTVVGADGRLAIRTLYQKPKTFFSKVFGRFFGTKTYLAGTDILGAM